MSWSFLLEAPIGLGPVVVLLIVLQNLDSFRLVSLYTIGMTIAAGGVLAIACYLINGWTIDALHFEIGPYSRYVSPVIEETLKAAVLVYLFSRNHVGFMVDAAIIGFAVGTGFALVENIYFLHAFPGANIGVWIIRGFGTALMHGGATAIFGVLAQSLTERHSRFQWFWYLPGLGAAIVLHSAFNHFPNAPLVATLATMVVVPVALFLVFAKSEHAIHKWLLTDYETHEQLLADMRSGEYAHSEAGRFVYDLAQKFEKAQVTDMFAFIQLHTELVLRAEQMLLERERGEKPKATAEDKAHFAELHALERRIGRTALLTLWPHLHFSRQELAELYELEHQR
ncbi:MAG: PrsW family intramembrane metalloprotease [Alphaproteobacteria bacterium]|nr:PrsW family intramembrane metalloprotease [Alphaproteobacteria bacterium]